MAITATISNIAKDEDATVVSVTYQDPVARFRAQRDYRLTNFNLNDFKRTVQSQIDSFSQVSIDAIQALSKGPFDPTITITITPEQQARKDYAEKVFLVKQIDKAISVGVKSPTDQDYIDAKDFLRTNFIDTYIDLF